MPEQSFYEVLGVERTASRDAIRTAYRDLAKRYHPDAHPDHPEYEEILKTITAAYGILGNEVKRAAYDLGLSPVANDTQSEPEDLWEPSPGELRDIYALDEAARAREIERLCGLHPHLRQFFDNRPPPPRFRPSDTYVAEFRLKDRAWRLSEIDRQCVRHPHLREWFSDLETQCERAEEEREREIGRQRARSEQYESERMLFAGAAFGSLGGMVGLMVGFIPAYIVGTVFALFSGAWGTPDRQLNAHEVEMSWFWFLWIVCGLAGAGLFFAGQAKERWLESPSRDVWSTRLKGILISAPCLALIILMISTHANTTSAQGDHLRSRLRAEQIETAGPIFIKGVTIDGEYGYLDAPHRAVTVGRLPVFAISYERAKPNEGLKMRLMERVPRSLLGFNVGDCTSAQVASRGTWTCRWNTPLQPSGDYYIEISTNVNNQSVGKVYFTVMPSASK